MELPGKGELSSSAWRSPPILIPAIRKTSAPEGAGGADASGNERLLPSSGMGFLPPEHPRDGLGFPFLLCAREYPAASQREREGKRDRVSLVPRRRTGCSSTRNTPVGSLAKEKGRPRAGQAWDGAFWESPAWKKAGLGDPCEIPPRGKGRTPPGSHGIAVPNPRPGAGAASALAVMGDEGKSQLWSLWGWLGASGSTEIHLFSCLA